MLPNLHSPPQDRCSFSQTCPPALASHLMLAWPLLGAPPSGCHLFPLTRQYLSGQQPGPTRALATPLLHLLEDGAQFVAHLLMPRTYIPSVSHIAELSKRPSISSWSSGKKNNPDLTISYLNLFISWIPGATESLRGTQGGACVCDFNLPAAL